ncbi:MAG: NusG domain II-containing protein [Ruminococcus sp.]|nr:NusG domain II-containing protein [Ruminococcus sp.]
MTKGVKICLAVVSAVFAVSLVLSIRFLTATERDPSKEDVWVEIEQDKKVLYRLNLADEPDRTFRITGSDGGWNEITISRGRICVSDADCPDHTCVKNGWLRYDYLPIICLPHKLVVRFCEGGGSE